MFQAIQFNKIAPDYFSFIKKRPKKAMYLQKRKEKEVNWIHEIQGKEGK